MSRSSLITGLVVAAALHAILFWPSRKQTSAQPTPSPEAKPPAKRVKVFLPPPSRPRPVRKAVARKAPTLPMPPARPMEKVHKPVTPPISDIRTVGDTSSDKTDGADLPVLRISWRSPRQLREVAAALGMSIVAVDGRGRIAGQVAPSGPRAITPFAGSLGAYSNRVRTLPRGFFGASLAGADGQDIRAFWILVPANVDRRVIAAQRTAIAAKGLTPGKVRAMEGRFEQTGRTYRFVVTDLTAR